MPSTFIFSLFQLASVLSTAITLIGAFFLLREKAKGAWIMLGGGVVSMMGQVGWWILPMYCRSVGVTTPIEFYYIGSAAIALGAVIFSIGLLLHALRLRGQGNRVAELEAILTTIQKS